MIIAPASPSRPLPSHYLHHSLASRTHGALAAHEPFFLRLTLSPAAQKQLQPLNITLLDEAWPEDA